MHLPLNAVVKKPTEPYERACGRLMVHFQAQRRQMSYKLVERCKACVCSCSTRLGIVVNMQFLK